MCPGATRPVTPQLSVCEPRESFRKPDRNRISYMQSLTHPSSLNLEKSGHANVGSTVQHKPSRGPRLPPCPGGEAVLRALQSRYIHGRGCHLVNPQPVSATHRMAAAEETVCTFYKSRLPTTACVVVCRIYMAKGNAHAMGGGWGESGRGEHVLTNRTRSGRANLPTYVN